MKQIDRILIIIDLLRSKPASLAEIKNFLEENSAMVSLRQIQRDLLEVEKIIYNNEKIITFRNKQIKYYKIEKEINILAKKHYIHTNFYVQLEHHFHNIPLIEKAIQENKSIIISELINDQTCDNGESESKNIYFLPISMINHRNSIYVGGYNKDKKVIQIFGINQLKKITLSKSFTNYSNLKVKLKEELLRRFGVTKNINDEIYDIKIEVSSNLAGFIESHHWHSTQKTTKRKSNIIIHFKCGINRELLGWLCQWMYNVRVIEPEILKTYYEKTIKEIQINNNSKLPLVYRNIFINNQ